MGVLPITENKKVYQYNTLNTILYKMDWKEIKLLAKYKGIPPTRLLRMAKIMNHAPKVYDNGLRASARWHTIGKISDILEVPMEMCIDEAYYFNRAGHAGYRLVCEAYRKGLTPDDIFRVTRERESIENLPKKDNRWLHLVRRFIKCHNLYSNGRLSYGAKDLRMFIIYELCQSVGLELYDVFRPYKLMCRTTAFGEIHNTMSQLTREDSALLAGIAKIFIGVPPEEKDALIKQLMLIPDLREKLYQRGKVDEQRCNKN